MNDTVSIWKQAIWEQLGAAIDTLDNAIVASPDDIWGDRAREPEYWYSAFHAIFFLDFYLHHVSSADSAFAPPAPFTLDELDPAGILPDRVYTKDELRSYLAYCRTNCQQLTEALTDEQAARRHTFPWGEVGGMELLLYTMRHLQHHAAQLNLILRQRIGDAPRWVAKARSGPSIP